MRRRSARPASSGRCRRVLSAIALEDTVVAAFCPSLPDFVAVREPGNTQQTSTQHATDTVQHATATVRRQVTAEMIKRKPPDNSKGGDRRSYEIVVDIPGAPAHKARRSI